MTVNQIKNLLLSLAYDENVKPEFIEAVIRQYIFSKPILPLTGFNYAFVVRSSPNKPGEVFKNVSRCSYMEAPIKLTTSGRGKLTTCFAGEDLVVQVYQG